MKTWLFVDGYNIIGAWPELTQLRDESLEEARKKVIDYLSEYAATTECETVLVFDGWRVKGNRGSSLENPYIEILFTPEASPPTWPLSGSSPGCPSIRRSTSPPVTASSRKLSSLRADCAFLPGAAQYGLHPERSAACAHRAPAAERQSA